MDKLPPYPFRPQLQLEKDIADQICSKLPVFDLKEAQGMFLQLELYRQQSVANNRPMGKSMLSPDVYVVDSLGDVEERYGELASVEDEKPEFKPKQFYALNDENIDNRIRMAMDLTVNKPKGEW